MQRDNPFNENTSQEQPYEATLVDTTSDHRLLKVLATVAFFGFFSCCGIGTLLYWGLQGTLGTNSAIKLPTRTISTFDDDARQFNNSLEALPDPATIPIEVRRLVDKTVAAINTEKALPFNRKMFAQAVAASRLSGGSLGTIERITIRRSLDEYEPPPTSDIVHHRILNVRIDEDERLGTIDLITYEEDEQVESHQWFIVKQQDAWEFYDWQRLEYGRRCSDEYAAYVHGSERISSGFDDAMARLHDVVKEWNADNQDEAFRLLKSCEMIPMLPEDHDEAMLQFAYMWQAFDEYEEAIRVAKRIKSPDKLWGAWPIIAVSYVYIDNYDEAMKATLRAQKQSPNHPNVQSLLSTLYAEQEELEASGVAATNALTVCTKDQSLWRTVARNGRSQDISLLLDIISNTAVDYGWQYLLSEADGATEWAEAFIQQLTSRSDVPAGVLELAQGSFAWSKGNYGEAGDLYFQARSKVTADNLKERAKADHVAARIEEHRYSDLFDESKEINATVSYLVELAFDDDLYVDEAKLLESLQNHREASSDPWTVGLKAWARYSLEDYEAAFHDFVTFLTWLTKNEDSVAEDQEWLLDTAEFYISDTLIELNRHLDVLDRWPDDASRVAEAIDDLLTHPDALTLRTFLDQTAKTNSDSVRVQRLRLEAELAMRSGNAEQCDTFDLAAISLANDTYESDEDYLIKSIVRERAKHLVWNRIDASKVGQASPETEGQSLQETLIIQAVQAAVALRDDAATTQWTDKAQAQNIVAGDSYITIQDSLADLRMEQGHYSDAIDSLRACIEASDSNASWRYRRRQNKLLTALLSDGRWDEAIKLGEKLEGRADEAPVELIVAIARGDADQVNKLFKQGDEMFVDGWIDDVKLLPQLAKHAEQTWLAELMQQYMLTTRYKAPSDHGRLLFKQDMNINEQQLRKKLNDAMNQDFTVTSVASADVAAGTEIWLAHSTLGHRVLLSQSLKAFSSPDADTGLAESLNKPIVQLSIEIVDAQPMATQRLFQVAAALAEPNAIAFSRGYDNMTWTGDNLQQQLTWVDRGPVGPEVHNIKLVSSSDSESEADELTTDEWQKRLDDAGGPLDIILVQSTRFCREKILAKLVEASEYDVTVTAETNSVINPLIRKGIQYNTDPTFVIAAAP